MNCEEKLIWGVRVNKNVIRKSREGEMKNREHQAAISEQYCFSNIKDIHLIYYRIKIEECLLGYFYQR